MPTVLEIEYFGFIRTMTKWVDLSMHNLKILLKKKLEPCLEMNPLTRAYNYHVMRVASKTAVPGYKGKEPVGCEADMRRRTVAQSKVHLIHKTVWDPERMTYVRTPLQFFSF